MKLGQNDGLIKRKLYKNGLVNFTESGHFKNGGDITKLFSGSLWDSGAVKPAWMIVNFLTSINIYAYSLKGPIEFNNVQRYLISWSVFDLNGQEIDRHENDTNFSTSKYNAFVLSKKITTNYLKIVFNKTVSSGATYLTYFDVFGTITSNVTKYFNRRCITKKHSTLSFLHSLLQTISIS